MSIIEDIKKVLTINVIKDFEDYIEKYHEQYGEIEGIRIDKTFYRVNSKLLQPLLDKFIMSNNESKNDTNLDSGYITYMNDVLETGYVPKHISCLLKQLRYFAEVTRDKNGKEQVEINEEDFTQDEIPGEETAYKEVLSSQILNYYGCPTVYNAVVNTKDKDKNVEYKLLSVDFEKEGQDFKTLEEMGIEMGDMDENLIKFLQRFNKKLTENNINIEMKNKLIEQYIYSFLVRKGIIFDGDFFSNNVGIINNNGNYGLIHFDFENAFDWDFFFKDEQMRFLQSFAKNLKYVKVRYPHIFNKYVKKTEMLMDALNEVKMESENNLVLKKLYRSLEGNLKRADIVINHWTQNSIK